VIGGAGDDEFAFANVSNADHATVVDFEPGEQLKFSEAAYGDLGETDGPVSLAILVQSGDFDGGTSTGEGTKGILYNPNTGKLWWDEDGAGGSPSVHIATFANTPIIPDADFIVED
jgi:hypothetical protein